MPSNALVESTINDLTPRIYWKMKETSGTTLAQSGAATTAAISLSGTYTLADDELVVGDSTKFITFGTSGKGTASRGNYSVPVTTTSVSFLMKIKADFSDYTSAPTIYMLGASGETEAVNVQQSLRFTFPGRLISTNAEYGAGVDLLNDYGVIFPGNFYSSNTVYHIAVTRGADAISGKLVERMYVNGHYKFSSLLDSYPTGGTSASTFYINTIWDNRAGLNVTLGHLAIWNRALTRSEVYSIAEAAGYNTYQYLPPQDSNSNQYWGDYETIQNTLKKSTSKSLLISSDPLINRSIINPEEAYESVEF